MKPHLFISSLALAAAAGAASAQEACSTYEIQPGDSLRELTIEVYSTEDFRIIFDANRDVIGNNPNIIRVGDVLTLPCLEDIGRAPAAPQTEAEAMASEMASELVKAAEDRAEKAIAEARKASEDASDCRSVAAKPAKEIEAARSEAAALIRNADARRTPRNPRASIAADHRRQLCALHG